MKTKSSSVPNWPECGSDTQHTTKQPIEHFCEMYPIKKNERQ